MKRGKYLFARIMILGAVGLLAGTWGCVNTPDAADKGKEGSSGLPDLVLGAFETDSWDVPMGKWMAEDDSPNKGTSTAVISRVAGQGGSAGAIRFDYTLGTGYQYRYGLVKIGMNGDKDFSGYKTLSFWIRGSGLKLKVHIGTRLVTDYDYHEFLIASVPAEWTEYNVPVTKFFQEGWGAKKKLDMSKIFLVQFQTGSMVDGEKGWLELDNVKFTSAENSVSSGTKDKTYPVVKNDTAPDGCYLGVFGQGYERSPDMLAGLEARIGKKFAQVMWYIDWSREFPAEDCAELAGKGYIPHITWEAWINGDKSSFSLDQLLGGQWDRYVTAFARAAKAYGKPFFLRWGHEFNGNWYPWSVPQNGMDAAKFVRAYRYLHDIFVKEGATNALWVWCPNNSSVPDEEKNRFWKAYPGDAYVDWIGIDGYNFGHQPGFDYGWLSFEEIFTDAYTSALQKFPEKPLMIGEFASGPVGGDKVAWIRQMGEDIPAKFPGLKSVVWFNINKETDWTLDGDPAVAEAAHAVFQDPYFCSSAGDLATIGPKFKVNYQKYVNELKAVMPEKTTVAVKKLSAPVKIDGNLSDWPADAASITISRKDSIAAEGNDKWKDDRDLSAVVRLAWDASALYLGLDITDDVPLTTKFKNGDSWQGDCVEIVFGANPKDDPARTVFSAGDFQLLLNPGNGTDLQPILWNMFKSAPCTGEGKSVKTDHGYTFEIRIDWVTFNGVKIQPGTTYGFNLAIDDADASRSRETQALWYGKKNFYKDPSVWNQIQFLN
ncbi:MAG: CIA30 family protein [Spirochaetales bacterium]|nr:CIA30 family protein [Spirochaetales bacterium]